MDRIQKRFDELIEAAEEIRKTKATRTGYSNMPWVSGMPKHVPPQIPIVSQNPLTQWRTSVLSLLHRVFGEDAPTFHSFKKASEFHDKISSDSNTNIVECFEKELAIFLSAKSDYDGGFLFDIRNLVHADVFTNELEQALYFHGEGWKIPALVIAGTVLESTLRELCDQNGITFGKPPTINPMNDELAKAGIYNKAMKTQILNWGQNRNSAAHGKQDELEALSLDDVKRMIDGISEFVAKHMD